MNIDNNTKRFIIDRLKWLGLYLGIGLILVFLLPSPYDLISVLGLFILVNFFRMRSVMKRYGGMGRIRDMFVRYHLQCLATINTGH
jgi:formate hydrogenlyase subunit 4